MAIPSAAPSRCPECGLAVPPLNRLCPHCGAEAPRVAAPTETESQQKKDTAGHVGYGPAPPENADPEPVRTPTPAYLRKLEAVLAALLLLSCAVAFARSRPDVDQHEQRWIDQFAAVLAERPANAGKKKGSLIWPPPQGYSRVFAVSDEIGEEADWAERVDAQLWSAVYRSNLELDPERRDIVSYRKLPEFLAANRIQGRNRDRRFWLIVVRRKTGVYRSLDLVFWHPDKPAWPFWERTHSETWLDWHRLFLLWTAVGCGVAFLLRRLALWQHRSVQERRHRAWEARWTARRIAVQDAVEGARRSAQSGSYAAALIELGAALQKDPGNEEALALQKKIRIAAQARAPIPSPEPPEGFFEASSAAPRSLLYLHFIGTPFAFRFPDEADEIVGGRQKRAPGEDAATGSGLVLRVASDSQSLKISRRHFRVKRIDDHYFLYDLSLGNTTINGQHVRGDTPRRVQDGDLIGVAGVLTIEVKIRPLRARDAERRVPAIRAEEGAGVNIEASMGELVTLKEAE